MRILRPIEEARPMRFIALATILLVTGCGQSKYEQAKDRVAFLKKNNASLDEICTASKAVVEAAADERRDNDYQSAQIDAGLACQQAMLAAAGEPPFDANAIDNAKDSIDEARKAVADAKRAAE